MKILIPSYGRTNRVEVLKYIPEKFLKDTFLCVAEHEHSDYKANYPDHNVIAIEEQGQGMGAVRKALTNRKYFEDDIVFLIDDDLYFAKRKGDPSKGGPLERVTDKEQMVAVFDKLLYWMIQDKIPQVALAPRNGNNRVDGEHVECCRQTAFVGLNLNELDGAHYRLHIMEDLDITLQLLRAGKKNRMLLTHCWDQGSNSAGGCSSFRSPEVQSKGAHSLRDHHPEFVKVVVKNQKQKWFADKEVIHHDVIVQWKKAFSSF